MTATTTALKAPLKWAGSKKWLIPRLKEIWYPHRHRTLNEPFVGGLNVALGLLPDRAKLNDANPHLVNFYQQVKQGLEVKGELKNDKAFYLYWREAFNRAIKSNSDNPEGMAILFYYLNRTCFNGLCRFNNKGEFNVPFGSYKTISYRRNFFAYMEVMRYWFFTCGDFEDIEVKPNDFIYCDPPYDTPFTTYSAGGFDWNDQVRLVDWLSGLEVPIVASNQATERILKLYESRGFDIELLDAPRSISCNGDRSPAKEMLATKNL